MSCHSTLDFIYLVFANFIGVMLALFFLGIYFFGTRH
jgi:hypothetical protein